MAAQSCWPAVKRPRKSCTQGLTLLRGALLLVAPAAQAHALLHALRQGAGAAALLARVRVAAHAGVGTAHTHAGASAGAAAHGVHHARLAGLVVPANALQMTDTRMS